MRSAAARRTWERALAHLCAELEARGRGSRLGDIDRLWRRFEEAVDRAQEEVSALAGH